MFEPLESILDENSEEAVLGRALVFSAPYRELMAYYRCAIMAVETKFNVLNEDLSLQFGRSPIETIRTRLKTPESVLNKLLIRNCPLTVESVESNLTDVAGLRVICAFLSDIYTLVDALLKQDDIRLLEMKDYIAHPKESGYRSVHLIVEVPIFLHDQKRLMKVEIQFRTISMDWWASLEHRIRYKKGAVFSPELAAELKECADLSGLLDDRMEMVRRKSEAKQ